MSDYSHSELRQGHADERQTKTTVAGGGGRKITHLYCLHVINAPCRSTDLHSWQPCLGRTEAHLNRTFKS